MGISFAVLMLWACSEEGVAPEPENVNAYFDHLDATQTDVSVVDLDNVKSDEIIELTPDNVLGYRPEESGEILLGQINAIEAYGDSLYVSSLQTGGGDVFAFHPKSNDYRKLGRKGSGPGEYQAVAGMIADENNIYFLTQHAKLIKHGASLNVIDEITLRGIRMQPMREPYAIMSDSILIAPLVERQEHIFATLNINTGAIIDSLVTPLDTERHNFPKAHNNNFEVSNSSGGRVVFTFPGMGVSKIYYRGEVEQVFEFSAGWFDELEPPQIDMPELDDEEFVLTLIQNIHILDNRDLLVITREPSLYYLKYTDRRYEVEARYQFQRPAELQHEAHIKRFVRPSIFTMDKNNIYFTSVREDYPYRVPLDKIVPSKD